MQNPWPSKNLHNETRKRYLSIKCIFGFDLRKRFRACEHLPNNESKAVNVHFFIIWFVVCNLRSLCYIYSLKAVDFRSVRQPRAWWNGERNLSWPSSGFLGFLGKYHVANGPETACHSVSIVIHTWTWDNARKIGTNKRSWEDPLFETPTQETRLTFFQKFAEPKISNFDSMGRTQQEIIRLQIPVNDTRSGIV